MLNVRGESLPNISDSKTSRKLRRTFGKKKESGKKPLSELKTKLYSWKERVMDLAKSYNEGKSSSCEGEKQHMRTRKKS